MTAMQLLILACSALATALIAAAIWPGRRLLIGVIVGGIFPTYMLAAAWASASNLWPVAVAIACVLTLLPAYLGAGLGEMIGRKLRPRPVLAVATATGAAVPPRLPIA